jgi:NAD+ synthase (glutamine-hydrolysing)
MKIAMAQVNSRIGDLPFNTSCIINIIEKAKASGASLVVFPELSVCGYPPRDLLNFDPFIEQCLEAITQIASHCNGIAAIVGGPDFNKGNSGKRLFNAAFFLEAGKVKQVYHKGLLPDYDVFDEFRYFEPAKSFRIVEFQGKKIAITVCEDIWNLNQPALYSFTPMEELIEQSPDLIINISASPFSWNHCLERLSMVSNNARKYSLPIFYCNQMGAHTELIFDGGSSVFNSAGELVDSFEPFTEDLRVYHLEEIGKMKAREITESLSEDDICMLLHDALVMGLRDYFHKQGLKKAILGLSGGLDSALVLVLAARALGNENVWAILLPGPYSTDHSVIDARELAQKLNIRYDIISINDTVQTIMQAVEPLTKDTIPDTTEENVQARARAIILMALSNKFGHVLLNTSNKSEAAAGYGTLYGDMCGGLSVIGDLYKTQVFSLARFINASQEIIPEHTIIKPPSAELKPDQKDSDSLPEYPLLDSILFKYIEKQMTPGQIVASGHDADLVNKVVKLVNNSEFKRQQAPPALRVSSKAFGSGRQMPIVAKHL